MNISDVCPCPKITCENRGDCFRCTSVHLEKGSLNACGFYTVLPALEKAIAESPESPTARALDAIIQRRLKLYDDLNKQHGRTREDQQESLKKIAAMAAK